MLEDYDPYFANFIEDVGTCISTVFRACELFIGLSYFMGSKFVGGTLWMFGACSAGYNEVSVAAAVLLEEITEFGTSFGRAVLLIYYGALKVIESFYIAAVDLHILYFHVTNSLSRTVMESSMFAAELVTGIFTKVPQQLIAALSMIGESALASKDCVINILKDFLFQLVWSPINALLLLTTSFVQLIAIPAKLIYSMPTSSFIGLLVIVMLVFACRRLLRYLVLRNLQILVNILLSILSKIFSLAHVIRLKNFVSSSVGTIVNLHDQRGLSETSKVTCVVCQDKPISFMSHPCKHVCLCEVCVYDLIEHDNRCPICRARVSKYDRVFIP